MTRGEEAGRGPRAVSLVSVAAAAGVSISTVSRIVNGEIRRASPETVERVRRAIEAVGYRPNRIGRALRRGESRLVAMLVANLDNPVIATIAASTETALRQAGYVTILCDTHDRPDLQDEYLEAMRAQAVQGYVLVMARESPGLAQVAAGDPPMVFVGRRNPCGPGAFVGIDNHGAGAAAAEYLWREGITAPGVVAPLAISAATRERVEGFRARLETLGADPAAIRHWSAPGLSHLAIGYEAAQAIADWPAGLLCVSDQVAYGAFRAAREAGVAVPETCRLVGIDGNAINPWIAPWLRSVGVQYEAFGPAILDLMQGLWGGGRAGERLMPHGPVA